LQIGDVWVPGRVLTAPMTGITDLPFRRLASRLGAAYVATEMVASAELARGRPDVVRRAAVGEGLPLTVIQLVGRDPGRDGRGRAHGREGRRRHHRPEFRLSGQGGHRLGLRLGPDAHAGPGLPPDRGGGRTRSPPAGDGQDAPGLGRRAAATPPIWRSGPRRSASAVTVHGRTRQQFYTGVADWTRWGRSRRRSPFRSSSTATS
jgi:tRNA-dihydrouridine synthase B